jgi:hypothetical protein
METPSSVEDYGYYCDIEQHTSPRIFISEYRYGYRVIQMTDNPTPTPKPNTQKVITTKPSIFKMILSKYIGITPKIYPIDEEDELTKSPSQTINTLLLVSIVFIILFI